MENYGWKQESSGGQAEEAKKRGLREYFGYDAFRPGQEAVVDALLFSPSPSEPLGTSCARGLSAFGGAPYAPASRHKK